MNDAAFVGRDECLRNLHQYLEAHHERQRCAFFVQDFAQVFAVDIAHRIEIEPIDLFQVIGLQDIGVLEVARDFEFALEPLQPRCIGDELGAQDFECQNFRQRRIKHFIDRSRASRSQLIENLVSRPRQDFERRRRHCAAQIRRYRPETRRTTMQNSRFGCFVGIRCECIVETATRTRCMGYWRRSLF